MTHAAKDTAPRDLRHSGDLPTSTSAEGRSIIDPATGAVIDTVPERGRDAVDAAVGKARAAFEHGSPLATTAAASRMRWTPSCS
jgi:acyl-CoA reductase-like NAD-dependent aldehyde dehydrogenase